MDASNHFAQSSAKNDSYKSESVKRNNLIFAIIMIAIQIGIIILYGFLIYVPPVQLNISSSIVTIGLAILVIAGFGLIFGYTRKMIWSGIGFTFFITAFCIEVYPLINDFWTKVGLMTSNSPYTNFSDSNKFYNIYLSDRETSTTAGTTAFYGNSITNSIKCALSVAVAFSAILGRAGQLECLFVSSLGVIGFELNRQLIQQNQGTDIFGTFYIFTFGGFMGLGLGLLCFLRERKVETKFDLHSLRKYTGSTYSTLQAFFGALIIFALFPLLAYEFDSYARYNSYSPYSNPVCIIAGLGAGAIGAILTSSFINGEIIARDAIHGPIAGAIVVGASSLYITNPTYAFVAGAAGGIIQTLVQNLIEKVAARKKWIISTVSWSLFGLEGLVGAGFAAGWKAIYFGTNNGMTIEPYTLDFSSQFEFYGGLISAGIGAGFGLLAGLLVLLVNNQQSRQYFEDFLYWKPNDGIRYEIYSPPPPPPVIPQPVKPAIVIPKVEESEQKVQLTEPEYEDEFDFSEGNNEPNPYAYL